MPKLQSADRARARNALLKTAARFDGKDGARMFIEEMLTESEQITIGRRLLIAHMLLQGKNQQEIRSELGVSPNTFTRTRQWLLKQVPNYGDSLAAYEKKRTAIQKGRTTVTKRQKREYIDPTSFSALKRRYPAHFLLFNIIDGLFKDKNSS